MDNKVMSFEHPNPGNQPISSNSNEEADNLVNAPEGEDPAIVNSPAPENIPASIRPPGAEDWISASTKKLDQILPEEDDAQFSAQSKAAIRAINEGLKNPDCTQLDGYGPHKISVQMRGNNMLMDGTAFSSNEEYVLWLKQLVDNSDSVVSWEQLQVERVGVLELPDGERLCIFLPPMARHYASFSLRKHTAVQWTPEHFVEKGTLDHRMLGFLQRCIAAKVNVLFVGEMGSGKTSLMRSLIQSSAGDNEKIAIVEQVPELSINKPLATEYVYQPTVPGFELEKILDFELYNGLSRLIVGEVHLEGITKMLETMILTKGSMSTYHAFSTEQAGERMKMALQLENGNIAAPTAVSFIRQAIEMVIVLEKIGSDRKITQISEIDWRSTSGKEQLSGSDIFTYNLEEKRFKTRGTPLDEHGRIYKKLVSAGYMKDIPQEWFIERENLRSYDR
jgi:pilus assembly protein CpaF